MPEWEQNDQFPPDKLSHGCGLSKQTFAGMVARRKMHREQPSAQTGQRSSMSDDAGLISW